MTETLITRELIIELDLFHKYKSLINRRKRVVSNDIRNRMHPDSEIKRHRDNRQRLGLNFNGYVVFLAKKNVLENDLNYCLSEDAFAFCAGLSLEQYHQRSKPQAEHSSIDQVVEYYQAAQRLKIDPSANLTSFRKEYDRLKSTSDRLVRYTNLDAYLVNRIRHEHSNWDHFRKHHDIPRESFDYFALKTVLLQNIAVRYPSLVDECYRQIEMLLLILKKNTASKVITHEHTTL